MKHSKRQEEVPQHTKALPSPGKCKNSRKDILNLTNDDKTHKLAKLSSYYEALDVRLVLQKDTF